MRHRAPGNLLSRPQDQRKAVLRSLTTELLRHDEIVTTLAKAKALQPEAERMITLSKKGIVDDDKVLYGKAKAGDKDALKRLSRRVHLIRQASGFVYDKAVVDRLFNEIAGRYKDRKGGYTRILKAGFRRGDATPMALIQLV